MFRHDAQSRSVCAAALMTSTLCLLLGLAGCKPREPAAELHALAASGNASAAMTLATLYLTGNEAQGIAKDEVQHARWLRAAADGGIVEAQHSLGVAYEEGLFGLSRDPAAAETWFRKAADGGSIASRRSLADALMSGRGDPADYALAAEWYRSAAEAGDARSQLHLAEMYLGGMGVPEDLAQAAEWSRRALPQLRKMAEQGDVTAQRHLGWWFNHPFAPDNDDEQGVFWYRKAAEQGDSTAQYNLAVNYISGRGVPIKDPMQALIWFRRAAEAGDSTAQYRLAMMYVDGEGVKRNASEAVRWMARAARQDGYSEARLEQLVEQIPTVRLTRTVELRERPEKSAAALATVPAGERLYRLEALTGWDEVYLRKGHLVGFVESGGDGQ
jgi:uncharacterized protein